MADFVGGGFGVGVQILQNGHALFKGQDMALVDGVSRVREVGEEPRRWG